MAMPMVAAEESEDFNNTSSSMQLVTADAACQKVSVVWSFRTRNCKSTKRVCAYLFGDSKCCIIVITQEDLQ